MESKISKFLNLKYSPVATIWSDEKPENVLQFKKGKWGCVMWLFVNAAFGKIAVFDRETYGCWGGGVGLGFGNKYVEFPGGLECFYYFLSTGNKNSELGKKVAQTIQSLVRKDFLENFLEGERYLKTPEIVKEFVRKLPITEVPTKYVIFKPLEKVDPEKEIPKIVTFLVNPNQLSALIILANYNRYSFDNVIIPWAAGCQTIGIFAYEQINSKSQKAIIGLTDISARLNIKHLIGDSFLTFSIPWEMFLEMENNVEGSFLERQTWKKLTHKK